MCVHVHVHVCACARASLYVWESGLNYMRLAYLQPIAQIFGKKGKIPESSSPVHQYSSLSTPVIVYNP